MTDQHGHVLDRTHRTKYRRIGVVLGTLLMVAAVVAVVRNPAIADGLGRALRSPNWDALAALVGSIFLLQLLSAATFHQLMAPHGKVGFVEMNALVAASTLGNYVPMQAGSLGRVAYHHAVNGIPVRASLLAIVKAMVAMFIAVCLLGAVAMLNRGWGGPWWVVLFVPALWLPVTWEPSLRVFARIMAFRTAEVLVWTLHAWAAFKLSGWPIEPQTAVGVALVGSLANLVPFIGNGLGIREWAVAIAAPILGGYERDAGLAAELVGRAVDVLVAVPLGVLAFSVLVRRARAAAARAPQKPAASE